jgi:hypothetical protein
MLHLMVYRFHLWTRKSLAEAALYWARSEADWPALAEHIRQGGLVTPDILRFVCDILDGTVDAKPQGTVATQRKQRERVRRTSRVIEEMGRGKSKTAAICAVAAVHGIDESTVRRDVATYYSHNKKVDALAHELKAVLNLMRKLALREAGAGKWPSVFDRYYGAKPTQKYSGISDKISFPGTPRR